jgi:hypothetical protein
MYIATRRKSETLEEEKEEKRLLTFNSASFSKYIKKESMSIIILY